MTGIVDYNAGNIKSVARALAFLQVPYTVSSSPAELSGADRLIFPGVGDAAYAMQQLRTAGLDSFLTDWAAAQKPLLGICLGSQIIFDYSEEGDTKCLGLVPGTIRHFSALWAERRPSDEEQEQTPLFTPALKVPQMGWNDVTWCNGGCALAADVRDKSNFYFVHSYVIQPDDVSIVKGYTDYGVMVPAAIEHGSITAFQFHPEKSGKNGLALLRRFVATDKTGGTSC